jgi:S1-C subfamily serine protease
MPGDHDAAGVGSFRGSGATRGRQRATPKPHQPPATAVPIAAKSGSTIGANPAMPVAAKPAGRRMLPPPRKPVADTTSDANTKPAPNPVPTVEFASDAPSEPVADDVSFAPPDEPAGDVDFFSELSMPSTPAAATVASGPASASPGSTISKGSSSKAASKISKLHRPAPKQQNNQKLIWIITGSVTAVAVLVVATVLLFGGNGTPGSTGNASDQGVAGVNPINPAHLVFDWPEEERIAAKLEIDGKPWTIPATGPMDFTLPKGSHRIGLRRLGNAAIDQSVVLKDGERFQFQPEWKQQETGQVGGVAAANPADSDLLVTDALPELKHWSTDFDAAKKKAAGEKKNVMVVFFGPDNRQWCLQLAVDLLVKKEFRKYVDARFELVLLEAPTALSTKDGKGVEHAAEMAKLAADYTIKSFPTIVLTDADGFAFTSEEYRHVSVVEHLEKFSGGLTLWKEGKKLVAPTETGSDSERVDAAIKALDWLEKNRLIAANTTRLQQWLELAEKVDPNNAQGKCEGFFLAQMAIRLDEVKKDDPTQILAALQPLDDWKKAGRQFKDGNLGAAFYLHSVIMLARAGDEENAERYATYALDCHPTDPRLRAFLGQVRQFSTALISSGSGFSFADGGYILTNNHVIDGDGKIFVRIADDKKEYPAEVVSTSPELDVAVIKMTGQFPALKPLPLATVKLPRGTEVVALGYPLPQDFGNIEFITKEDLKLTQGPISAPPTPTERFYVLDVKVNHGNSGGPLVDMKGEVVGIVSAKTNSFDADSYGLAIPGKTVADYVETFKQKIPGYHSLSADESAKLPEMDKLTKVDAAVSPSVVQIVKRRG